MKKIIVGCLAFFICTFTAVTFAGGNGIFEQKPDGAGAFGTHLNLSDRTVRMVWNEYAGPEDFVNYAILRSQDREKLSYPENNVESLLWWGEDIMTRSYVDESPLEGKTWYKLCIISSDGEFNAEGRKYFFVRCSEENYIINNLDDNRACLGMSQRQQYAINDETGECRMFENPCDIPENNWTAIKNWSEVPACNMSEASQKDRQLQKGKLDKSLQIKVDTALAKLFRKIEAKYSTSEKRETVLLGLVKKLKSIKETTRKKTTLEIIDYLIIKIQQKIDIYNNDSFSDIENLLNQY